MVSRRKWMYFFGLKILDFGPSIVFNIWPRFLSTFVALGVGSVQIDGLVPELRPFSSGSARFAPTSLDQPHCLLGYCLLVTALVLSARGLDKISFNQDTYLFPFLDQQIQFGNKMCPFFLTKCGKSGGGQTHVQNLCFKCSHLLSPKEALVSSRSLVSSCSYDAPITGPATLWDFHSVKVAIYVC